MQYAVVYFYDTIIVLNRIIKFAIMSFFLCSSLFATEPKHSPPSITIPLHYHPQFGIYTAFIHVGQNPVQSVEAIVDTGSSNMVFIANQKYCPSCSHALTKGYIDPFKINKQSSHKLITISYGSAHDTAIEYIAPIQYINNQKKPLLMNIFVLKYSSQPTSIIGMVQQNLIKEPVKSTTFLIKMTDHFNKYNILSFVLCGNKGDSYFQIGPINLEKPLLQTKLISSHYYEINTFGFYDEHEQMIVKPIQNIGKAILDTGTGGFIVLTEHLNKSLNEYLFQHAGRKNQKLGKYFWNKNDCVPQESIDFNAFPLIKIALQTMNNNQPYYLRIKPTTYINQAGCDNGYVRLIFTSGLPPNHPTAIRNYYDRAARGVHPDMVIGTALLNDYATKMVFTSQPYIELYDNKDLCVKK